MNLEQFLATFNDSFVKNENGFEVVQPYAVEEYERFITDVYNQAQKNKQEEILHKVKTMNQGVGIGAFVKNLIWFLEGKKFRGSNKI